MKWECNATGKCLELRAGGAALMPQCMYQSSPLWFCHKTLRAFCGRTIKRKAPSPVERGLGVRQEIHPDLGAAKPTLQILTLESLSGRVWGGLLPLPQTLRYLKYEQLHAPAI